VTTGCSTNQRPHADHLVTAGADDGVWPQSVSLQSGESLDVRLPSQAGTGYAWRLGEGLGEDSPVVWTSRIVEPAREKDRPTVAGPTWDVFTFEGRRQGEATVRFVYDRPFEPDTEPAQRYELLVIVTP
jgi:inhibitor of cysteine peptidase